ncbi:MAG: hypothetical protein KJN70_13985 [Eudoraea sp.]|nr:hypothetical protein [Eudoraea sp.]
MNYDSIIRRARKAVQAASAKLHSSKVHIVDQDADIKSLSGLVVILAEIECENTTQTKSQATG